MNSNTKSGRTTTGKAAANECCEYVPSPEQIRRQCADIQAAWSAAQHERRAAHGGKRWTVPVYKTPTSLFSGLAE